MSEESASMKKLELDFYTIEQKKLWPYIFHQIKDESMKNDYSVDEAKKVINKNLNRYRDVNPYDHSRVVLSRDEYSYINASYINVEEADRRYILTQGPLPNTILHFWLMIWEQNSRAIIMLNKIVEKNQVKCSQYWPNTEQGENKLELPEISLRIELLGEKYHSHYIVRNLRLINVDKEESREIFHYHYTTWPDFGVPRSPFAFLKFLRDIRQSEAFSSQFGPPVVHCSAGIGRSGTFCLVDTCLILMEKKGVDNVNVAEVLLQMRKCRMGLIQTADQLRFSYIALLQGLKVDWSAQDEDGLPCEDDSLCINNGNQSSSFGSKLSDSEDDTPPPLPPPRNLSFQPEKPLPGSPSNSSASDSSVENVDENESNSDSDRCSTANQFDDGNSSCPSNDNHVVPANPSMSVPELRKRKHSLAKNKTQRISDKIHEMKKKQSDAEKWKKQRTEMDSMKTKAEISYSKGNRAKNEQLTVKWLANSVTEIRAEIAEMIRSLNSSTELQQRQTFSTDIAMLQNDIVSLRHDIESLKGDMAKNNAKSSVIFQDIEVLKQLNSATSNKLTNFTAQINGVLNEWARSVKKLQKHERRVFKKMIVANENPLEMKVLTLPQEIGFEPRKRKRHFRPFEDESSLHEAIARSLRNDLNKQKNLLSATSIVNETDEYSNYSKTNSALLNLEKRISRLEVFSSEMNVRFKEQEKLHSSMLELLESVENIEAKVDSVTPDLKKEISKLEFTFSQITSNATILLEKQESQAKMIKLITENLSALEAKVENNRNTMVLMNGNENEILSKYDSSMFACNVLMALLKKNLSSNVEDNNEMETSTQAINEMLQGLQFLNYQYKALRQQLPKDCADVDGSSGIHLISPDGGTPVLVFCEISNLPDSSSYTVIQRRINGKVNFNRSWEEYATGFGNLLSEFWLGNEIIHRLTKKEDMIARIEFEGIDGKLWYAQYDKFVVASREEKFRLTLAEFSGNATNALEYQNHMEFSTSDSDHDISNTNCAASYEGGWWFSHCQHTNLNGKYNVGLTWFDSISNEWIDISSSKIMLTKHKR